VVVADVVQARRQIAPEEWLDYELVYVTDPAQVPELLAWLADRELVLIDTETDGKSPDGLNWRSKKIATLQIGDPRGLIGPPRVYVCCMRSLGSAIRPVIEELATPRLLKLGQNIRFELMFLGEAFDLDFRNVADTQVVELILRAGLFPISREQSEGDAPDRKAYSDTKLESLMRRHCGVQIEKGDHVRLRFWVTEAGKLDREQLEYAAGDVIDPWFIIKAQMVEVRNRRLSDIIKIEFELIPLLVATERRGICLDRAAWLTLWQEAIVRQDAARKRLDAIFRPQSQQSELFGSGTQEVLTGDLDGRGKPVRKRVERAVRPTEGTKELNYDAPAQVKEAFRRYCRSINWPAELVTSMKRLNELKAVYGKYWLAKHEDAGRPKTVEDVPDWLIPEDRYVILIKFEGTTLELAKLRGHLPRELTDAYLEYKEAAKLAGTYGLAFLNKHAKHGNRVHVYFHQAITSTGRLSSEPNLQNIPRDPRYRACFKPSPGHKFIIFDYSAIEPRLSAETSQDPNYLKTFRDQQHDPKVDIYCRVGSVMLGREITRKDKPERQGMKSVVLGTAYNMGARKLRDDLTLKLAAFIESGEVKPPTFEYTAELRSIYFETHPGIKRFQNQCIAYAAPTDADVPQIDRDEPELLRRPKLWDKYMAEQFPESPDMALVTYVEAPCGRKRWFPATAKGVYTEAPNAPIQACSATITKLAACLIQQYADAKGYAIYFVNYVHDELVVEVPDAIAEEMTLVVKEKMEEAGRRYIKTIPVLAEAPMGDGIFNEWYKEV